MTSNHRANAIIVFRHIAIFLFAITCCTTTCGQPVADVQVELHPDSAPIARPGTSRWVLTMTNIGAEPITFAYVTTDFYSEGPGQTLQLFPSSATAPCTVWYFDGTIPETGQVYIAAHVGFQPLPLAPGASVFCEVELVVDQEAPNFFSQGFALVAIGSSQVPLVRFLDVPFLFGALREPIPAGGFGAYGLLVLGVFLVVVLNQRVREASEA